MGDRSSLSSARAEVHRLSEKLRESEQRFAAMADSAPMLLWMSGIDGKCDYFNASWLAFTGRSLEQESGDGWTQGIHPDDRSARVQMYRGYFERRQPFQMEYRLRRFDGEYCWVIDHGAPRFLPDGTFVGYIGSLVDVTARQRDAVALRRSEQHFRAIFDQAAVGITEADASGRYIRVNDRFCEIVGYSAEELRSKTIWDITDPQDLPHNRDTFTAALAGGQGTYKIEKRYIRKDGSVVWVHNRVSFIPGSTRQESFFIAVVEDITARKQAQDDLRRAKQEAEDANAAKDQFLAVLSHELRTPLTPVLTTVHLLGMDPSLPAELGPLVQMIRRNVELEARLIDDLLDLTRIAKGKLRLSFETVDTHATLRSVLDICRADMAEKTIRITTDLQAAQYHVRADPARLQQVFWNLLKNAVKFTPAGGNITIHTRNETRGRGVEVGSQELENASPRQSSFPTPDLQPPTSGLIVEITDTGIGIEPDNLARIFFAFEQLEQSVARRFGGLGLGLAISKSLVDLHGGKLSASSPGKGQGATFTVGLQIIQTPLEQKPTGLAPSAPSIGRPIRILMVDDHEDTSRAMKRLLEQVGYEVHTKHTVREALDAANATRYDLLISDIGLPDGSGVDLIRQLRHRSNDIRAVALSGFGMDEDIRRSKEAGFHDHLTKPVNFSRLQEVIAELVGEK